ncbi:f-box domain-containing protein [Gigaspora margarita]|uniref:F-box domain-containing protein n=1 Tax=Gigaspora margarita TaxID=4874 RepID=A0A8H4AQN4_GIGMA|nr:f-box domain-containing protein [Gigaspora margarita]
MGIAIPSECLLEIFEYLDRKYLFSCLLVNRQWCRYIVPILWSRIDELSINKNFIRTCLLLLNTEEQASLIPFNIMFPNDPKPLFEYTKYITHLRIYTYNLFNKISKFYGPFDEGGIDVFRAINCLLISKFLRTGDRIKCIEITAEQFGCCITPSKSLYLDCFEDIHKLIIHLLSENLYKDTTLASLSLNFYISSEEANILANALCKNTTLTSLKHRRGNFYYEEVEPLILALHQNTTLTCFDIARNRYGTRGGMGWKSFS